MVDKANHKRMVHALEITRQAGVPYSSFRTGRSKERGFRIVKLLIDYPREQLFSRINLQRCGFRVGCDGSSPRALEEG